MPVVRNTQFYFREGFCWNNVLTTHIKCRKKQATVHSTESMSFFSETECVPEFYMIAVMNSRIVAYYVDSFVNSTSHCTTGDAKLIPIVVPTEQQLSEIIDVVNKAINLRIKEKDLELEHIQNEIDKYMHELYAI